MTMRQVAMGLMAGAAVVCAMPATAWAQEALARGYTVAAGDLGRALDAYARQSGRQILYRADDVRGIHSPGAQGRMTAEAALARILSGTGFAARTDQSGAIAIVRADIAGTDVDADSAQQEIIVTANRREQLLQNVPSSVTAETGAALARRGATQIEDIVRTTPGLSNPGSGGGNKVNLTIRNVATGADPGLKQSTVAVLFDDIPLDPGAGALGATNLRLVDVERVEVLRGPQGTLFGSGSLSGALRVVTNRPDMTRVSGSAEVTGTTTRHGDGSVWGNAVLNLPLVEDRLAMRIVGFGFQEGGWVDNVRTGTRDVNGNETYGGRVTVAARLTDRFSADATFAYQDSHDYGAGESLYVPLSGADDPHAVTDARKSQDSRIESTVANLALRYSFDPFDLLTSSTYIRRNSELNDDVGYYNDLIGLQFHIPGLSGPAPSLTSNDADIFTQEVRLVSTGQGALQWTLGGFYLRADADGGQWVTSPVLVPILGSGNLATLVTSGAQEEIAGFGELTYALSEQVDVTAGLRVSDTTLRYDTLSSGLLLTGSPSTALTVATNVRQSETTANPRFALSYRPNDRLTLYAQAARGYRVGGPNQTAGLGGPNIPRSYDSDHLWNYELGAKGRNAGGTLHYAAAVYYIDWSDMQASLRLNNVGYVGNAGSARIYGIEVEAAASPLPSIDLGGSMTIAHAETTSTVPNLVRKNGLVGIVPGYRLPASPEFQASGYAQYLFDLAGNQAYLRADAQYIGAEYTDFDGQGTRFGDYATVNLRAGVRFGHVELIGFVNNLFDSNGARAATDLSMATVIVAQSQMAYRVRPRTIGATLRAGF